ncbi:DUF5627 domain-containing protein [Plebeiibacterium marinum]|uniref:DUF5627 domain-containing protein n=1 Tax=Plebeiibacterium marinum TaxID=2992111 RepID=A0AAE3SIF5_9BACT|nr:DUF5627 domain-containing protein [Plebeiobacterium marinum]MCW3804577.1 DUF5627 domain-containing protein [Plebeiobacterium marinum]
MKLKIILLIVFVAGVFCSCENSDISYPDFDYTTVYFADQYPLRTLELGKDLYADNSLDNEHKVRINATTGGGYSNTKDITIDIQVDESLCDGVSFVDGSDLVPMPSSYYNLGSNKIVIEAGKILGGVDVELTNAFFEDPLTIGNRYVIPLIMTDVVNADSILSGKAAEVENPNLLNSSDWSKLPKNYILYAIKYVNPWHATYLRRGEDQISDGVSTITDVRSEEYVANDELVNVSTLAYKECSLPITIYEDDNETTRAEIELILTFDDNNNCTIASNSSSYTVSGTGKFVTEGEKNSWGGLDRDGLYLDYTVELTDLGYTYATKDTLVCRNRGVSVDSYSIKVE